MKNRSFLLGIALLLLVSAIALLAWQWRALAHERVDLIRVRLQQHEAIALRTANERLAADVPLDELEALRRDRAELVELQEAVFALLARQQAEKAAADKERERALPPLSALPPLEQPMKVATDWTFAGNATPRATFESLLWAAARGETGTLTALLYLDTYTQKKFEALFAKLSPEARTQAGEPATAFASFVTGKFPQAMSGMGVVNETEWGKDEMLLRVHLQSTEGRVRETSFKFRRSETGWSVVVPNHMVQQFTQSLRPAEAETADD